ncbi:MAG: tryptophan/tyrosine permease [Gammaproteobacteria bacterium]|nr:tryptophan/tyrosine permease [Gammaproteobacteria bacterium]MCH9717769.1 tryptophan/tyrosine permease [Gammaproteobacteria bacterium]MCH9762884.1 tryptophan/tyrosine permease [Gammaproteobacteria bacterium]
MQSRRVFGGMLMILGTCIGAGMLAIPIVSAHESFRLSALLLVAAWFCMTIGAFAVLEVNLWFKPGSNLVSMAEGTLGAWGKIVTSLLYLLLMYSLICAYLSSASGVLETFLDAMHWDVSRAVTTLVTLLVLGSVVYAGMGAVDVANRLFMTIKLFIFALIVVVLAPQIQVDQLLKGDFMIRNSAFIVMVTSFGFATILPTLREYLHSDRKALNFIVLVGSLVPFCIFLIWLCIVQGVLPREGAHGLIAIAASDNSSSRLMLAITKVAEYTWMKYVASIFVSVYVLTSFLSVSISLADFIADGLKKTKKGKDGVLIHVLCFLPPLLIVLLKPGIFITALAYAGIWCIALLVILPLLMLYSGRYRNALSDHHLLPGGRWFLSVMILIASVFLLVQFK